MADTTNKAEGISEREETPTIPATAPEPRPTGMAAVHPAHLRAGSEPKRLSKGQRKHIRRQKQAGVVKGTYHG